jgi:hypothetical protein
MKTKKHWGLVPFLIPTQIGSYLQQFHQGGKSSNIPQLPIITRLPASCMTQILLNEIAFGV